jgi:Tfp pilus assembly PilM family ATPase
MIWIFKEHFKFFHEVLESKMEKYRPYSVAEVTYDYESIFKYIQLIEHLSMRTESVQCAIEFCF